MRNLLRIFVMTGLILMLAACGGGDAPAATSESQPTAESVIETNAVPTLSQTYTSDGTMFPVGLSFQYPDGWVVSTPINNIILIATSEATASKTFSSASLDTGEAVIQLALNTRNNSDEEITAHVSSFAGSIGIPLGEASALTLGEHSAARVDGQNDARHLMVISVLFENAVDVVIGSGDTYVEAVTYSNPGEFTQMEPTLLAIIESINYGN